MHTAPPSNRVSERLIGRLPALRSPGCGLLSFNMFFAFASNRTLMLARSRPVFDLAGSSMAAAGD